jgi:hypothetical protein
MNKDFLVLWDSLLMTIRTSRKIFVNLVLMLASILLVVRPVVADDFTTWATLSVASGNDFSSIFGFGGNSIFIVGRSGTILGYDGLAWNSMNSSTINNLTGIWGTAENNIFAVGSNGTILHFDGLAWKSMNSGSKIDLTAVWGSGISEIFAVGNSGTILRFDGTKWNAENSGATNNFSGVWGSGPGDVYAVGSAGIISHFDGTNWSSISSGTENDLLGIWGSGSRNVWVVGKSGTLLSYDGFGWKGLNAGIAVDLYGIWGSGSDDIFVAGGAGTIAHFDGSRFSSMNRNTVSDIHALWGNSASSVFAVGNSGTVLGYFPPRIYSISRVQADQGEILDAIITGQNLTGVNYLEFGPGVAVNSFKALNSTQITANITVVSGAVAGPRNIFVTTPGGSATLPNSFQVNEALPAISSITPDQERQGVTLNVTISGAKLGGTTAVNLGAGIVVNSVNILSSNQITVNISIGPDAPYGIRDVSVSTPAGGVTLPNGFTVKQALPTISSINPVQANQATTLEVTISGSNLGGASELKLGSGITVNSFAAISPNQITANISVGNAAAIGTRDLSVTTPGGSVTLPGGFIIKQALPTIRLISPDNGTQGATLNVAVLGTNLSGTSELRLGPGVAVNSFNVLNPEQISAVITIVGGAEIGFRDVSLITPGGNFVGTNLFMVKQGLPVLASISPEIGNRGTEFTVIISGSNLGSATSVSFGTGIIVQSFTNLSPTQLSVEVKIDSNLVTGPRDVSVTTPGGSSTLANSFTIIDSPLSTLFVALTWAAIAVAAGLLILIVSLVRKKRADSLRH